MNFTRVTLPFIALLILSAGSFGAASASASAIGPKDDLLVLTNEETKESLLVYCQDGFVDAFVLLKNGQPGPTEGAPSNTPCSADSFDEFEADINISPYDGWVAYHPSRVGGLLGAYACTQEGTVFAIAYPEGFDSWKSTTDCNPGTVPG